MTNRRTAGFLLACTAAFSACTSSTVTPGAQQSARHWNQSILMQPATGNPIAHVVIVFQENRSFTQIFSGFPGADAPTSGKLLNGKTVPLRAIGFNTPDLCHAYEDGLADWDNGKMDGFEQNCIIGGRPSGKLMIYSFLRRDLVGPYWAMARRYTLADRMFTTEFGESFTAHLDIIAGTTNLSPTHAVVDLPSREPWGCDAPLGTTTRLVNTQREESPGPFPCFTQFRTMADTLDAANVSWRYYAPPIDGYGRLWSEFDAIRNVRYSSDWKDNVVSPPPTVLTDIAAGKLAAVNWVIPDWLYADHAPTNDLGPSWVAAVVNAVGKSKYWNNTAIIVMWDDWGGWYDDAAPPQLDFRGLGIRVPCIIISPYVRKNYVSHTQYEFGSVLHFIEDTFGLPPLGSVADGYTDTRGTSLIDSFDFTQSPSAFVPIHAKYPPATFINMPSSFRAPDDN
jgi:phospholipase C